MGRPLGSKNKKPKTAEQRENHRKATRAFLENGGTPSWTGKRHTAETRAKMSVNMKGKGQGGKGKPKTAEHNRKNSEGCLRSFDNGRKPSVAIKGKFAPRNPQKYAGDPTQIIFRSSWELKLFRRLDNDKNVVSWSSEEIVIPYRNKVTGRMHRYFPDVWYRRRDGKEFLVEVKPLKETIPPVRTERMTERRFMQECVTYAKNMSKWDAARRYSASRDWGFLVITERELGIR